ncbi:hypothetical protein M514_07500 [Trichuris suis]|uniref:Uncharacterized protein n=1 Tax=Trichuris suis TaxID=68888 RepID=A0A085MQY7_9BILA|nr:hypothetical protein M514_07500 [Trichuris suis]
MAMAFSTLQKIKVSRAIVLTSFFNHSSRHRLCNSSARCCTCTRENRILAVAYASLRVRNVTTNRHSQIAIPPFISVATAFINRKQNICPYKQQWRLATAY